MPLSLIIFAASTSTLAPAPFVIEMPVSLIICSKCFTNAYLAIMELAAMAIALDSPFVSNLVLFRSGIAPIA